VLVLFRQWDEVLAVPEPTQEARLHASNVHFTHGFWHFARGMAFAGSAQPQQAEAELALLHTEAGELPARYTVPAGQLGLEHTLDDLFRESDIETLGLAEQVLRARIAEARGQGAAAIGYWRRAVALQDQAAYSEPPLWYYPVRDSLGAALLRAGAASEAVAVFQEDLRRRPNDPRAYFGLAAAYTTLHQRGGAAGAQASFEKAWQLADRPLTLADL
jgi:predicted Zn-dependent protease